VIRTLSGSSGDFPARPSLRGAIRTETRGNRETTSTSRQLFCSEITWHGICSMASEMPLPRNRERVPIVVAFVVALSAAARVSQIGDRCQSCRRPPCG